MALNAITILDSVLFLIFIVLLFSFLSSHMKRESRYPLPPGPPRLPVLGNVLNFPTALSWEKLGAMGKEYGDLMSFVMPGGQTIIIINSLDIAKDLLEKRGSTWSDRPVTPLMHLMGIDQWSLGAISVSHSDAHRLGRRISDNAMKPAILAQGAYRSMQKRNVYRMLNDILREPNRFVGHIDFMLGSILLSMAYGYDLKREDDPLLGISKTFVAYFVQSLSPRSSIVNIFPALQHLPLWLPGMGLARKVPMVRKLTRDLRYMPFERVMQEIRAGTAKPSLVRDYLFSQGNDGDLDSLSESEKKQIVDIPAVLYAAGIDTTATLILSFLLALLTYPHVQQRAQSEIDSVVGRDRLPELHDLELLPYIQALCLELLRWKMVAPMGIPHATSVDDVYEGYSIPKGSTIFANVWAILHDPVRYPDPEVFRPERFLSQDGTFKNDPDVIYGFGFGRRICPGRFLAVDITRLAVMCILSVFNVSKAKDAGGNEIPVTGDYTVDSPSLSSPLPFECAITPRGQASEILIEISHTSASDAIQ